MLGQYRRRWGNIKPAFGQHVVFASDTLIPRALRYKIQSFSDLMLCIATAIHTENDFSRLKTYFNINNRLH